MLITRTEPKTPKAEAKGFVSGRYRNHLSRGRSKGKMNCSVCQVSMKKFGFFGKERIQRYRCKNCGKCVSDIPERPLDAMRLPLDQGTRVLNLLVEGVGIRACERLTGTNRNTVLSLLETAGQKCLKLMNSKIRDISVEQVQIDELFSFVGCKERNNHENNPNLGEQYTYIALEGKSKLILNYLIGKRDTVNTQEFIEDLKTRIKGPFQLTSDGYLPYLPAISNTFKDEQVNYGQVVKIYSTTSSYRKGAVKYSPSRCNDIKKVSRIGSPDLKTMGTSFVERANLSIRLFNRRFTRLTLGYSKKIENLKLSMALFICHYNFCRVHSSLKQTPAMAAGLTDRIWKIEDLLGA